MFIWEISDYVVLHGDDELDTGWSSAELTIDQCYRLLDVLKAFYENDIGLDLIVDLKRRIKKRV